MYLNLLSRGARLEIMLRRWLRYAVVTVLAWSALLAVGTAARLPAVFESRRAAAHAEAAAAPLRAESQELDALQVELSQLQIRLSELDHLRPDTQALVVLSVVSNTVEQTAGAVQMTEIRWASAADFVLSLQGRATDDEAVASFVDRLRASPPAPHVELKACAREQVGSAEFRRFDLVCRFK